MTELSENLKTLRIRRELSIVALAKLARVSRQSLSAYERSERKPKASALTRLAAALGTTPAELDPYWPVRDEAYARHAACHEDPRPYGISRPCPNCAVFAAAVASLASRTTRHSDAEKRALRLISKYLESRPEE